MARSSSTSKAAKLAQKGPGRTVRFQGGTVFPLTVALVLVLGLGLIVYGRQTLPAADASPPTINDHWHAAYGFNICGEWYQLAGNLEDRNSQGQYVYTNFLRTGIHSHDDGVIHWHPNTSRAVGKNAVLGVFLESYEVELTDDSLKFPAGNILGFTDEYIEGETQCDGEDASLSVRAWDVFTDTDGGDRYITKMDEVRLIQDNMVFAIYFGPDDMNQAMPPWASQLPQLGAIDSGQTLPSDLLQSDVTDGSAPDASVPAVTEDTGTGADE
ncbi:MAG: hypothetical protein ACO307_05350 [Ilumatobacteraceae bacterium]